MEQVSWRQAAREGALITLGTLMVAVGVYFFKVPNHFSTGGVSGLGVLLGALIPRVSSSTFISAINLLFLLLGFAALNRGFGMRTVYCSLLFSGAVQALEWLCPLNGPLTDQPLLELLFAVLLPAFGSAILFNLDASTGGTDIVAMILKKFTGLDVGKALMCSDVLIAASTFLVFDVRTGLFSILGLLLKSVLVDSVIESLNRRKAVTVVTEFPQPLCDYITRELGRGATVWEGKGAYSGKVHGIVLTALSRHQAVQLRRHLKAADPHASIMVESTSEIFGKGFFRG